MRTLIRFSIVLLFLVLGLQAATAQTPTRLRLKQLELAPDTAYVIYSKDDGTATWKAFSSVLSAGGGVTGSGTAGRVPRWTSSSALGDGVLRDDGTLLALGGATVSGYSFYDYSTGGWRLPTGTTAQRPTNAAGVFRYNSSLGYSETADGSAWLQSDFPAGTNQQTIRHNGTSWVSSNVYSNGNFLGIGAQLFTWPITISRAGVAQSQVLGIQIAGTEDGYIVWSSGSTSPYFMGKNTSGYWVMLEGNSTGTGIAYNRESNSFNVNDVFETKGTLTATWRAPSSGTQNNVLYLEGSSTSNILTFVNSGHLGINTLTPARTLHVKGEARISDLTTDTPTLIIGADADGDLGAVPEGYGINITAGSLEVDTTQIATQSDIAAISPTTLYTGDGTIATDRTVTISSDKTLTISGTTPDLPGYSFTEKKGYNSDWDTWGNYRLIYTDDYFTNFIQGILNYDSTVFVRLSAGDWVGDHFVSMQMDEAGNLSLSGFDDSGTSAGLNLSDNATVGGYGARLQGGAGIEFDTDTGGKFVYQVNNTTEAQLDATGLGLSGSTPAFTLDMENATDAIDMPGGTTAQRPTNESELLRYNSDNARMEYADGTNWRDLLPATGTTGSAILPSGTTAQRDGSPANGYIRYNSTIGELEAYVQSAWATVQASPRSYADMVGSGAAQYTVVSTEIIDTVTNIVAVGFTHSAGVLTYTGTTNKNFLVNISAVVGEADTDAATAVLRLYQNSSIKGVTQQYCALQDEKYAVSISRIVTLATSDTLDCRLATGGDWIVSNFYFNVTPID